MAVKEKETPEQLDRRLGLERKCAQVGKLLGLSCPPGVGYALLFFDFGEGGNLAYMSNGDREDMVKALEELLERWRGIS